MKIQLEYPYTQDWKAGYIVINRERRRTLILVSPDNRKSSTQYARYLLAVHLGRYLTSEETVDHIDGNKENDDISNLQILSRQENLRKSAKGVRVTEHGTLSMYRYCKCEACRAAKRAYMQAYSARSV